MPLTDLILRRPPVLSQADAAQALDHGVTVYWRDGCTYCIRMRWALRKQADQVRWVDIWADQDAAAFVRTTNDGGHEIVPTVVIDGVAHTNPAPAHVKAALARP